MATGCTYGRMVPKRDALQPAAPDRYVSNVSRLGLAWTYVTLGAGGGNQEGTPLVWNNTLYGITTWSVVFALDARTGKELWRWDPEVNQTAVRPKICCGIVNRGLAIYNGMIFAPIIDGRLKRSTL
jgi:quinohemoprotein ethanol dehydrogenase